MTRPPLLEIRDLARAYGRSRPRALDGVSLTVEAGRITGIVGESGSGKSTLARLVAALDRPSYGTVRLDGEDLFALPRRDLMRLRKDVQMVSQDPYGSLDPRWRVGRIVAEPLHLLRPRPCRRERDARVSAVLSSVGLSPADAERHPHAFSGGQRQRIALARALATRPRLVVADEPTSALDLSVQAQVLNLVLDLRERDGVAFLLVTHDLGVVEAVCDDVAVLYAGRIVEAGPAGAVLDRPFHPYTARLAEAAPRLETAFAARPAADTGVPPPFAADPPDWSGCAFRPRCQLATPRCRIEAPPLRALPGEDPARLVACHHAETMAAALPRAS